MKILQKEKIQELLKLELVEESTLNNHLSRYQNTGYFYKEAINILFFEISNWFSYDQLITISKDYQERFNSDISFVNDCENRQYLFVKTYQEYLWFYSIYIDLNYEYKSQDLFIPKLWINIKNFFRIRRTNCKIRKEKSKISLIDSINTIYLFDSKDDNPQTKINKFWNPDLPWGQKFTTRPNVFYKGDYVKIDENNKLNLLIEYNKDQDVFNVGALHSKNKIAFKYGLFEARIKITNFKKRWTAFWASHYEHCPEGYTRNFIIPEYDFLEMIDNKATGSVHFGYDDNPKAYKKYQLSRSLSNKLDLSEDYHVFGFERSPKALKWYIDGYCYYKLTFKPLLTNKYIWIYLYESIHKNFKSETDINTKTLVDWVKFTPRNPIEKDILIRENNPELFDDLVYKFKKK